MRVGSLVQCVDNHNCEFLCTKAIYTVRAFISNGEIAPDGRTFKIPTGNAAVYLEEVQGFFDGSVERPFRQSRFRELQPPIANIEEHINENTLTPELI